MGEGYKRNGTTQQQGYILTATSRFLPIIQHKGVLILKDRCAFVLHNSPTLTNSVGGSVISESLADWVQNRNVTDVEQIDIAGVDINLSKLKIRQYDLFGYNCEHFVCDLGSRPKRSPQLLFWLVIMIVILAR